MNFRISATRSPKPIDLTPLINIILLMLIFFMLAGSLQFADDINPAKAKVDTSIVASRFIVTVDKEGGIRLANHATLPENWIELVKQAYLSDQTVAIKPDASLPASSLVSLTHQLRLAGIEQITLLVESN